MKVLPQITVTAMSASASGGDINNFTNSIHLTNDALIQSYTSAVEPETNITLESTSTPMHTKKLTPTNADSIMSWSALPDYGFNNLDLIYSIADTYNLPSDSDTYSYISNCLRHSSSTTTIDKPKRSKRLSLHSQFSAITSDQYYPVSSLHSMSDRGRRSGTGVQQTRRRRSNSLRPHKTRSRESRHHQYRNQQLSLTTDSNIMV